MSVDHVSQPVITRLDELEGLEFIGEPFDPSRWMVLAEGVTAVPAPEPTVARPVAAPPAPAPEPARSGIAAQAALRDAMDALVCDIRSSVVAAHASALDAALSLQHRTAAALLPAASRDEGVLPR
jgi:hypothetical protein